jgi:hypothetical protein
MNLLWIFIIIVVMLICKILLDVKETFLPEYLNHKSKCFDCEKQARLIYGDDGAWRDQPTKSFASELQGFDMYGEIGGFIGKTMKYY